MDSAKLQSNGTVDPPVAGSADDQVIELARNQTLVITRARTQPAPPSEQPGDDCLRLLNSQGATTLTIRLTAAGPVVEISGGSMALKVDGDLAIAARRLLLHGSEAVSISSDADTRIVAGQNLVTQGRRQEITATHGDARVYANDDVKIDGERIRMNC
jgi:hypothetical protein